MRFQLACVLLLALCGCTRDRMDPDLSGVDIPETSVLRLEDDLFSLKQENIGGSADRLTAKYGTVYDRYLRSFLLRNGVSDTGYANSVLRFTGDADVQRCYHTVKRVYTPEKLASVLPQLDDCRRRFAHYFPGKKVPSRLVTCLTGWNYAFAVIDSSFVLGLDMYLGDTSSFYQMLRYPQYQVRKMNERYIVTDIARGWLLTEFDNSVAQNTLLHHTIFYGKLFYAVGALVPSAADSTVIGYSGKQMAYCRQFEKNLWGYFAEGNRLYESDLNTMRELTTDGPFSGAISKDCPPRIAMWIGWQIVRSYMEKNPEVTLAQLMGEQDPQKILSRSKYRP